MATLYEIDQSILECIDQETGEIIDAARLDALQIERATKIENVALWIKNLESDVDAMVAEMGNFSTRKKEAENKIKQLRAWLYNALEGKRFMTAKCGIAFRKSEAVEIVDEAKIPKEFMIETIVHKPDKLELKRQLKAGVEIEGCSLVERMNAQIK